MPQGHLSLLTTEGSSNEMLDSLLTTGSKCQELLTISKPSRSDAQERNVRILKTDINFIAAAKFKEPERRVDKVFQCRITRPYAKETMIKLLKQENLRTITDFPQSTKGLLKAVDKSMVYEPVTTTEYVTRI